MRIALDTNALYTTRAGTARYINGLRRGLQQLSAPDVDVTEFAWGVENLTYEQPGRALKTAWREMIWAPLIAPNLMRRQAVDLFHGTGGLPISVPRGVANVQTLLDCSILQNPSRFRSWQRWSGVRYLRQMVQKADRIICISRFTADEAIRRFALSASVLDVVYLGSDFDATTLEGITPPVGVNLSDEYFLFVGSLEPGKNISLLRQVWESGAVSGKRLPPLVVVGSRWAGVKGEGAPPENWVYLGHQPDDVLRSLYRHAMALVFPSQYEGFGLPVLEAMSVGCPVICSRVTSLPEVGGDAVLYCDADPRAYLAGMRRVLSEENLRRDMISAGLAQSRKFSWRKCAEETVAVYRAVCR